MSENYVVFLEQPLLVSTLKLATAQLKSRSLNDCFEWHPQEKVREANDTCGRLWESWGEC